jgi:amino acid transporter
MINATGEYQVGNYTIEATYRTHSNSTIVNMTDNHLITLMFSEFTIPEFPSFLFLPLFTAVAFLAVIIRRRKSRIVTRDGKLDRCAHFAAPVWIALELS